MSKILAKKLGFSLGLEDDAPAADITINVETDEEGTPLAGTTLDGENTVEQDQVETAEAESEVTESNDQVEELEEAQETLENYYVALEHYNRNGGMNREAAAMMSIGVEGVVRRFGITPKDLNISVESFGDNRQRATTISMEGVKDMLATIWTKIKEVMDKMWKALKNFYMKLFSGAVRLKKRAEAIAKKASNHGKVMGEKRIEISLLKQLHFSGKPGKFNDYIQTLEKYSAVTDLLQKGGFEKSTEEVTKLINSVDGGKLREKSLTKSTTAVINDRGIMTLGGALDKTPSKEVIAGFSDNAAEAKCTDELAGGVILVGVIGKEDPNSDGAESVRALFNTTKCGFVKKSQRSVSVDNSAQFDTLTLTQVETLSNKVVTIAENVRGYEKMWHKRESMLSDVKKAGDKAVSQLERDKENDDKEGKEYNEGIAYIQGATAYIRRAVNFESQVNSRALATSSAILNYCVASIRAHNES